MALCRFQGQGDLFRGPRLGWGSGRPAFVHAPFHQLVGQERQTEESNSIPVSVPTAPPSAQRSWTDQPECGEHCYLNSFSSSCAVLDGSTLKVSGVIFFKPPTLFFFLAVQWFIGELKSRSATSDSPIALVAQSKQTTYCAVSCFFFSELK